MPLLRHRLRRHGRGEGRPRGRHARGHAGRSEPRPQLREGLLPLQDHVRRGSADHAVDAGARRQIRQVSRASAGLMGSGLRRDGTPVEARPQGEGAQGRRHVRLGPVDDFRGLCSHQAHACGLSVQQSRSKRPPLHGVGCRGLHANLRHGRAYGLLRRFRERRCVRALGLEHGGDASDPVDPGHRPTTEPSQRTRLDPFDLRAPHDGTLGPGPDFQARNRSRHPQLHRQLHHPERRGEP